MGKKRLRRQVIGDRLWVMGDRKHAERELIAQSWKLKGSTGCTVKGIGYMAGGL